MVQFHPSLPKAWFILREIDRAYSHNYDYISKTKERDKLKNCIKGVAVLLLSILLIFVGAISTYSSVSTEEPTTTGSTLITEVVSSTTQAPQVRRIVEETTEESTTMSEIIVEKPNTTKATLKALTTIPQTEERPLSETNSLGQFKLTAYCPCSKCNGKWAGGITSTGAKAQANRTIAVDPSVIPYGSKVKINDKIYVAEDCGGAIKGNRIDIYFASHDEALDFGVQYAEVFLVVE